MKILDRYVLRSFLINYAISFMVLIGMYVVLDMVFAFDELWELKGDEHISTIQLVAEIGEHYFYQSFLIFIHLSGIIPVAAAAFTFIRMSRFNELSAMLAAGVPLLRVAAPVILASVVLQGLLAIDQELIIPQLAPKITRKHDELNQESTSKAFRVEAMQDGKNGLLFGTYTPAVLKNNKPLLRVVSIVEHDDLFQPMALITADSAEWDDRAMEWKLTNGKRITGLHPSQRPKPEESVATYQSNITPDEINLYRSGEFITLLSTEHINQLLQRRQVYGAQYLLRVKHFRISQLIMNVVMLLVAIPCVLTRAPGGLKRSITKCLVLVGLCFAGYFMAFQIADRPPEGPQWADRWPAMMAFAPVLIFGVLAVYLLDRLASKDT